MRRYTWRLMEAVRYTTSGHTRNTAESGTQIGSSTSTYYAVLQPPAVRLLEVPPSDTQIGGDTGRLVIVTLDLGVVGGLGSTAREMPVRAMLIQGSAIYWEAAPRRRRRRRLHSLLH